MTEVFTCETGRIELEDGSFRIYVPSKEPSFFVFPIKEFEKKYLTNEAEFARLLTEAGYGEFASTAYLEILTYITKHGERDPNELEVVEYSQLKDIPDKEQDWIVEGILPQGSLCVAAGKAGSYKSFACLEIALCLSTGNPLFGKFKITAKRPGVLFIDEENPITAVKKRIKQLGLTLEQNYPIYFLSMKGVHLGRDKWLKPIDKMLEDHPDIGLVVVDSLTRVAVGLDENEAGAINDLLQPIKTRTAETGVTWLFLHHLRKSLPAKNGGNEEDSLDKIRGSSDIVNVCDVVMLFQKYKPNVGDGFTIDYAKMRMFEIPPRVAVDANWSDDEEGKKTVGFAFVEDKDLEEKEIGRCLNAILKWAGDNRQFEKKDVRLALEAKDKNDLTPGKYPKRTIERALTSLVNSGLASKPARGLYLLNETQKVLSADFFAD